MQKKRICRAKIHRHRAERTGKQCRNGGFLLRMELKTGEKGIFYLTMVAGNGIYSEVMRE